MWQGKVARTERHGDRLDIIVSYSNGENTLDDTISTQFVQSEDWLRDKIQSKLKDLNALDDFEASINGQPILSALVTLDPETNEVLQDGKSIEITPLEKPLEVE